MERGDIIQANENAGEWAGCLLTVDEVKSFGCQCYLKVPYQGIAYMRLRSDQYDELGCKALLVIDDGEDGE